MVKEIGEYLLWIEDSVKLPEEELNKMIEAMKDYDIVCPLTTTWKDEFFLPLFKPEKSVCSWCFLAKKWLEIDWCRELIPFILYNEHKDSIGWVWVCHKHEVKEIDTPKTKIPKIIHQIWIGNKECPYTDYMKTWKEKNPTWEYILWTNDDLPELVNQEAFDSIKEFCWKADILRYELLYRYGWVYADADLECLEPLEDSFMNHNAWFCWEQEDKVPWLIANTIFWVPRNSGIMLDLIKSIWNVDNINSKPAWQQTWPLLVTNLLKTKHFPTILPSYYFLPSHHSGYVYNGEWKIYAEHHWYSTKK